MTFLGSGTSLFAFTPLPVADDPLVRMPGTQPEQRIDLREADRCLSCHQTDPKTNETLGTGFWSGSMMAQAARDPVFWATMTVSMQDSIWVLGNPNAADICLRCHMPEGWLGGRSDPPNASLMTGSDFDGVHCDSCHRLWDPFFETSFVGTRESADWLGYWDEAGNFGPPPPDSGTASQVAAYETLLADRTLSAQIFKFSGQNFFNVNEPAYSTYTENGAGQYFVDSNAGLGPQRASFADTTPNHDVLYSRYHKSKYFCSNCHDVSNPVLANLGLSGLADQSGGADLITEQYPASNYLHVERTFSEFMLSAYGRGGAATNLELQQQADPVTWAAKCQDCHMRDISGKGSREDHTIIRPDESTEHPNSGLPLHDLQGGNAWITYILGSTDNTLPTFDQTNFNLMTQGPQALTLNFYAGQSPTQNGAALMDASARALEQLSLAGTIKNVDYNPATGDLSFKVQNNTGHKLISGYPEGRRMFVNIKAYNNDNLIFEVNPYDYAAGTLAGTHQVVSPTLAANQAYVDELVYEAKLKSDLTGELDGTFHFALATDRYKDNRIPPKGFAVAEAASRLSEPVWQGASAPDYFTTEEYDGGFDDVSLNSIFPPGADEIEVTLYYQGTSRKYIEFLQDEINGTASTLSLDPGSGLNPAGGTETYIIQTDPFFQGLKAWGDTIWQLWYHNHGLDGSGLAVPGIVPYAMSEESWETAANLCSSDLNNDGSVDVGDFAIFRLEWGRIDCNLANPCTADLNGDGSVDVGDFAIFRLEWGRIDCL